MEQIIEGGDSSRPPSCTEKKVVFSVFKYFPYGGLQLDLMRMAQEFVSRGIKVVVYCMNCDIEQIPEGMEFRKLPAKGWSNHSRARNFEKKLRKELENESFFAHIAFNRLTPADWYFAADMPFVESAKRSFLQKLLHNLLLLRHNTLQMKSATGVNLFFIEELPGFNISLPGIQLIHSISLPRNIKELSLENIRCFSAYINL